MQKNKISRRSFLKGTAASAMGAALVGLSGCASSAGTAASSIAASSAASKTGTYTPGTYTAKATGIGEVTVTATFDETSITNIELDVSNETPNIGQAAKDELLEQLMAAQGSDIDGVSGATVTGNAAKSCLDNCIAQAKGEIVAAVTETAASTEGNGGYVLKDIMQEDIDSSVVVLDEITDFAQTIDCDVVVCGAGAAGVVAAVTAAEEGAKVCVLQKESVALSQGNCASAVLKSESTPRGLKKWIHECTAFNSWRSNPELLQAYVDNSEEALKWVCEKGKITEATNYTNEATGLTKYQDTSTVFTGVCTDGVNTYDYGDEKVAVFAPWFGPKPMNVGTLVSAILADAQEEYGDQLDVHFSTPVVQLVKGSDGSIVGCVGKDASGNYIKFNAKAVILATGDYENNPTMVRRFCPDVEAFDKKQYHRTGDGNILAIEAGGCMEPVAHSKVMHDFDAGLMWDEPFLVVNMEGERFMNEDVEMAYISNLLRYQPAFKGENMDADHVDGSKGWYCQLYDNDYMSYAKAGVPDFVMARYLKEEDASLHTSVFEELIDTFRADTIEELAEKLGLPVEQTVASVERYNELCDGGYDDDFGKKPEYMHKLQTAPFWGIRRHIRCSAICAGVLTDGNSRVVTEDGKVINGLYAVGNLGGQFFGAPDYPFFQGGLSIGRCFTFGRIAGKHAANL
jgi:succinate dehydrogenase/fumarate reductase flavoprotein subunit/uncharacterized protein with FMN-binding domain